MQEDNLEFTKKWIFKAQNDLKSAEILFKEKGPTDSICFHSHQTAEKMLKGFLVLKKGKFPKIHDLIQLLNLCKAIDKSFEELTEQVLFLNRYYVETRYSSEIAVYPREECRKALQRANKLTQFIIDKI